jgi:hypothetical protein
MKRFTDAGRLSLAAQNWMGALVIALMLPDVCGSMEEPGRKSEKRSKRWWRENVEPLLGNASRLPMIDAAEYWSLRNRLIHAGASEISELDTNRLKRFVFMSGDGVPNGEIHDVTINGERVPDITSLSVHEFCALVFQAADAWDQKSATDTTVQANKGNLLNVSSLQELHGGAFRLASGRIPPHPSFAWTARYTKPGVGAGTQPEGALEKDYDLPALEDVIDVTFKVMKSKPEVAEAYVVELAPATVKIRVRLNHADSISQTHDITPFHSVDYTMNKAQRGDPRLVR